MAEPYAGGAGAALSLLYSEDVPEICVNDADEGIHALWWALLHRNERFTDLLGSKRASMAEWRRQREVYLSSRTSRLRRGFAAFYLNRCNRSGIIMNGGPIGGVEQHGKWKIDARFNKEDLTLRCARVGEYAERIRLTRQDGLEFIRQADPAQTFFFIDPPYYLKGHTLYLNRLEHADHAALAAELKQMAEDAWVVTYDDCEAIRQLYAWAHIRPFTLRYAAAKRREGREVLITPPWMRLPDTQASEAIRW